MSTNIKNEYQTRLEKLAKIKEQGIDPYPAKFERNFEIAQVLKLKLGTKDIKIAGRLMTVRVMGKLTFAHLQDGSGKIQIALQPDEVGRENYKFFTKLIDAGDFLGVGGDLFKTHKGEKTIKVRKFTLLTKSHRPLPEKWHGLKDQELRYRERYLDLIVNPGVKEVFLKRTELIKNIRQYLDDQGFLEVETPVLEQVPGGAEAEPFITHHRTLDLDLYLRISLELHLKRLVIGGFDKVYEIGKVFRNEGMSTQHLQEFSLLEFYWAYADYEDLMKLIEDFYTTIIQKTFGGLKINYQGGVLDFKTPWPRLDYTDLLKKQAEVDVVKASLAELKTLIKKYQLEVEGSAGRGRLIDQLYKKIVRPTLVQPTFLINHPVAVSPLAKRSVKNPQLSQRLTVVAAGVEVGNGFSELNDPIDQRERFQEQLKLRAAGDKEAQMLDEDFLWALEHGLPPTAGFGVGIDRLLLILTNQESIRDVVLFPMMKPNNSNRLFRPRLASRRSGRICLGHEVGSPPH